MGEQTTESSARRARRRFARRQWARRWLAWRRVLAVVIVVGLVGGSVWLVFFSRVLAVSGVDVRGDALLAPTQVQSAAAVPTGVPLARVDLEAVRARVESLAPVRSAEVSRSWPDRILVRVVEREAVAVADIDGALRGMDASGVTFRDYDAPPPGLPVVRFPEGAAGTDGEAMTEAARVVATLPGDLAERVDSVEVRTVDQISLALRDGRVVVWGSAEESEEKARVIDVLLERRAREYDVSVPGQPTTRS